MQALVVQAAGQEPVLTDTPEPTVEAGSVLVRVRAAGLNPIDNWVAAGMLAGMFPYEYPLVVGRDAAGVVEAVGDGVTGVEVGDAVLGHVTLAPPLHHGTIAELALLPAAAVLRKPAGIDFVTAAALPLSGAAALACVAALDLQAGETVLVVGATGGVGGYVVQLAKARGATVVATGGPSDEAGLRVLGADEVVDYTTGPVADAVLAAHPDGVDALVDLIDRDSDSLVSQARALRRGGRVTTLLNAVDEAALAEQGLTGSNVYATPTAEVLGPLLDLVEAGSVQVSVGQVLSMAEAQAGLATIASGQARGKLVVQVG